MTQDALQGPPEALRATIDTDVSKVSSGSTDKLRTLSTSSLETALAEYAHDAWAGWMAYLFSKSIPAVDGTYIIPAWAVERWQRQLATHYIDLPENEKLSDIEEARKILQIIKRMEVGA